MVGEKEKIGLTRREIQVLQLLSEGKTRKEIAVILHIAETTAKTYMERLRDKFDVSNCSELVYVASKLNFI